MKPKNASEVMWLRALTVQENMKQNAQTQNADGMHSIILLYLLQPEASSPY